VVIDHKVQREKLGLQGGRHSDDSLLVPILHDKDLPIVIEDLAAEAESHELLLSVMASHFFSSPSLLPATLLAGRSGNDHAFHVTRVLVVPPFFEQMGDLAADGGQESIIRTWAGT